MGASTPPCYGRFRIQPWWIRSPLPRIGKVRREVRLPWRVIGQVGNSSPYEFFATMLSCCLRQKSA
jgi:hypothetical protein